MLHWQHNISQSAALDRLHRMYLKTFYFLGSAAYSFIFSLSFSLSLSLSFSLFLSLSRSRSRFLLLFLSLFLPLSPSLFFILSLSLSLSLSLFLSLILSFFLHLSIHLSVYPFLPGCTYLSIFPLLYLPPIVLQVRWGKGLGQKRYNGENEWHFQDGSLLIPISYVNPGNLRDFCDGCVIDISTAPDDLIDDLNRMGAPFYVPGPASRPFQGPRAHGRGRGSWEGTRGASVTAPANGQGPVSEPRPYAAASSAYAENAPVPIAPDVTPGVDASLAAVEGPDDGLRLKKRSRWD